MTSLALLSLVLPLLLTSLVSVSEAFIVDLADNGVEANEFGLMVPWNGVRRSQFRRALEIPQREDKRGRASKCVYMNGVCW
jgi:hypothetical protein